MKEMDIPVWTISPSFNYRGHDEEYHQWTGLGPLQQFNVGAVGNDRSPNLRKSSDLTKPHTLLFWDQQVQSYDGPAEVDFKRLFCKKEEEGRKLFSLPSFTAPDTEVLQSFSGLDPRIKQSLRISQLNEEYVERLKKTYWVMLEEVSQYMRSH